MNPPISSSNVNPGNQSAPTPTLPTNTVSGSNQDSGNAVAPSSLSTYSMPLPSIPSNLTINSQNTQSTTPVAIPDTPPVSHAVSSAVATNSPAAPVGTALDANGNAIPNNPNTAPKDEIASLLGELSTKGQVTTDLQNTYGLDTKTADATSAYNAYQSAKVASDQQINDIMNTPGITRDQATAQATEVQRLNNANLANLSIIANAAAGNLSAVQSIIKAKIDAEFQPIQDNIDYLTKYVQLNNQDLSDSDKATLNGQIAQQAADAAALRSAKTDAYNTAVQYGANAKDLADIGAATDQNSLYAVVGRIINGTSSNATTDGTPSSSIGDGVVNGYDLSTYATDPQYPVKVQSASTTIGSITNAGQAQSIISSIAPTSPVTGAMVMQAAQTYGVDPNTLLAQMKVESNFGTLGAGAKTNNPANVGNTDDGKTQTFKTVQDGVNAQAQWLASHSKQSSSNSSTVSNGGITLDQYNMLKKSAPLPLQQNLNYTTASGDMYIDGSSLPQSAVTMANAFAAKMKAQGINVPVIQSASQVADLQSADKALQELTNIQNSFTQIAPTSFLSTLGAQYSNTLNSMFQTNKGNKINAYNNSIIPGALSVLGGITGSSRVSAVTGNISAASLPKLSKFGNLIPTTGDNNGDTLAGGLEKINTLKQSLNTIITSILPNSKGAALADTIQADNSASKSNAVMIPSGTDGTSYGFPGYVSDGTQWVKQK